MTEPVRVVRDLPCKLTDAELLKRGDRIADIEFEIDGKKEARKGINREIKKLDEERHQLSREIDSGEEERSVKCRWEEDFAKKVKRLIREDTGDVVDEVTMSAADLQTNMKLDGDGKGAKGATVTQLEKKRAEAAAKKAAGKGAGAAKGKAAKKPAKKPGKDKPKK